MKVIDKINNGLANHNGVVFSFEFFPPRTEEASRICIIEWIVWSSTSLPSVTSHGELVAPLPLSRLTVQTKCRIW